MKIESLVGPSIVNPAGTSAQATGQAARERAIAMLTQSRAPDTSQEHPVRNPSQVSPEELSAVKAPQSSEGQKVTAESVPQEAPAETKAPEEPLSAHYANLARKEKALRAEKQKLLVEKQAFEAARAAVKPEPAVDNSKFVSKEDLLKDPFSILADLGLSYDQLTNAALNQPSQEELARKAYERKIESQLAEIKASQEQQKKDAADSQAQAYQQAISQIRLDTKQLIKAEPDSYEAIASTDSVNDVVDLIERTFKEDGILLSVEEAAKHVEEYLVEEAMKISKLKKIQQRMQANSAPKPAQSSPAPAQASPQMKTLTNAVSSSRQLSTRERAILAFEGKLKA
jgi:hypothetical protein